MSSQYPFSESDNYKSESVLDSTVLVEDGVVWDQEEVQVSLSYSNDQDDTLTENHNESYLTANEGSNDTHYFSVLETTNEAILNNLSEIADGCNETEASEVAEEQPAISSICTIGGQPDIYRIEGSDDLYAFEVAYDQEGNTQRFRYRLRLNENGEYESVPESIELLPLEHEAEEGPSHASPAEIPEEEEEGNEPQSQRTVKVFVKQELSNEHDSILPDIRDVADVSNTAEDSSDDLQVNEDEAGVSDEEQTNTNTESKAGILEQSLLSINKVESETFEETFFENTNHEISPVPSNDHHLQHDMDAGLDDGDVNSDNFKQMALASQNADEEDAPEQANFEQILMEETHEPEEESKQSPEQVEKPFVPESDDNTDDGNESSHSEDSEEQFENRNADNLSYLEDLNENESDTDDYQIVDGVHVTADTEAHEDATNVLEQFLQREPSLQHQILKIQQQVPVLQSTMNDDKLKEMVNNNLNKVGKGFTYYVVKHPEKENVAAIAHPVANKIMKTNPRSVLKSSYIYYDQKKENEKPLEQKIEKKLVKNKEAMQAKFLHNFIAKTTILHAPVRQQRLPRKQTIKPVERADEEIIVQEVVVSSNGFIETSEDGIIKSKVPLKPTEIVQLSDSDDDYDPKKEHKRKKKQKKRKSKVTEIVISDSEEDLSDDNVIQIDLSADSDDNVDNKRKDQQLGDAATSKWRRSTRKSSLASSEPKTAEQGQSSDLSQSTDADSGLKKKRGRPPKRRISNNDENTTTDGSTSSSKKQRRNTKDSLESNESSGTKSEEQTTESEIQNIKTKWKCTKCPKTFPSQGSLKTHMQYHNFHEPSSRNLRQSTNKQEETAFKKPESTVIVTKNKYECSRCGETFKNIILLTRHTNTHVKSGPHSLECSICRKPFADRAQLINHKRTHVKEQMFKTTTLPKHSPKSTASAKTVKSSPKKSGNLKCNYCTKIFTSLPLLNAHTRTHKRFTCNTCTASFISKLALEDHIHHSCVKQSKLPARRLSLKTRKSFLAPPQRVSKRISLRKSIGKSSVTGAANNSSSDKEKKKKKMNVITLSLQCDTCSMTFASHKALFSHKVVKHGLNTPDKSALTNPKQNTLHKESGMHSSVPASDRLRSAYSNLKTKLDF